MASRSGHLAATTRIIRAMPATDKKQALVWNRWITYLGTVNRAEDPFLDSLDASPPSNASSPLSSAVSPKPFEQANFNPEAIKAWLQEQSRTTSDRWFKPSGLISRETPRATRTVNYPAFYQSSTPVSKARIPPLNENALLASASSE
jgi:hypothetical protein